MHIAGNHVSLSFTSISQLFIIIRWPTLCNRGANENNNNNNANPPPPPTLEQVLITQA
jgi:hypothetical protein